MDIEAVQQIIVDYHEQPLPSLTKRSLGLCFAPNMALGIIGVRRCGKTFRTHQLIAELHENVENVCRIQFNDHRLAGLKAEDLHVIDNAYYALFPEKRNAENVYFIFDEIHRVEGWEDYILYLLETMSHRVLITGSSSKLSTGSFASQLRGKILPSLLQPFSYSEFLKHYSIEGDTVSSKGQTYLLNALDRYLSQGGLPGLLDLPKDYHHELLKTYWDTMLLRDVIEAHPNENINSLLLRQFACALASRNSCAITVSKLTENMSNLGFHFTNDTLYRYLSHLNEAFLFDAIEFYSPSERVRNRNYKKLYCVDWALAYSITSGDGIRKSRNLENIVYSELKRRKKKISYFRTREGFEIDFAVNNKSGKPDLIQVCYSLDDPDVKKREFRSLQKSAAFFKVPRAQIITYNETDQVNVGSVVIDVIPAWKWLLGDT